jgi:hypothetical protein
MWNQIKDRIPAFVSKRIGAGVAGVVAGQAVDDPNILWYTLALIASQTLIDCVKAWRNDS